MDRFVGRNLRLSRADPTPWFGQPSPLRCALLSPAGLASRRGPHTKTHLGLCPKTPLTLKLRLDMNDAKHRPYGAADTLSRCLRRILCEFLQKPN